MLATWSSEVIWPDLPRLTARDCSSSAQLNDHYMTFKVLEHEITFANCLGSMNRIFGTSKKAPKPTLTDAISSVMQPSYIVPHSSCLRILIFQSTLSDRRQVGCYRGQDT